MNVLLIGQGPLPSTDEPFCTFSQLRTWSMHNALRNASNKLKWTIELKLLTFDEEHSLVIDDDLLHSIQSADVIVTAGPYYPLFILPHVPVNTPIWLDFPSDPFADLDAKQQVEPFNDEDWNVVTSLRTMAFERADALGVISNRQKWVCYGALLEKQAQMVPVKTIPIAFDFPTPLQQRQRGSDFLLAGSGNAWMDLCTLEEQLKSQRVHCTGWTIPGYSSRVLNPNWIQYGWLKPTDLQHVMETCQFGVWADRDGPESTLGSRTRALFYIWSGLTPIGSLNTELATDLYHNECMRTWDDDWTPINIVRAQAHCQRHYGPNTIYTPLLEWLQAPKRVQRRNTNRLAQDNLELREALSQIHHSPTWKITSRIHRLFKR